MAVDSSARSTARPVDAGALLRIRRRLEAAPEAPWLHSEAARRMGERLLVVKARPRVVLDWWAQLGGGRGALQSAYPQAQVVAVEPDAAGQARAAAKLRAGWWSPRRWSGAPAAWAEADVPAGEAQLVWANMMLHAVPDPAAVIGAWQRALAVDGFLMFSTLGPGSLESLRALYRAMGWPDPFAPFVDMHDLGDMLVQAGFADPVMDQELVTLTWPTAAALLDELRSFGGNAHPARHAGLRTRGWRVRLEKLLTERLAGPDGRLSLALELVYGHAFKPLPRPRVAGVTNVPLDDLRTMARAGKPRKASSP